MSPTTASSASAVTINGTAHQYGVRSGAMTAGTRTAGTNRSFDDIPNNPRNHDQEPLTSLFGCGGAEETRAALPLGNEPLVMGLLAS